MPRSVQNSQEDLVLPSSLGDHPYSRMDLNKVECESGPRVTECKGLVGMETVPISFPKALPEAGESGGGPVCFQDISPATTVHELERGSPVSGSGRTATKLGGNFSIRFPTILPDPQGAQPGKGPVGGENDHHYSPVAIQTLVPSPPLNGSGLSSFIATMDSYLDGSSGESTSTSNQLITQSSGMASIRRALEEEGVSEDARELIVHSRRKGTSRNYGYASKKWTEWCRLRKIDPFSSSVSSVLNFLAELFRKGLESKTIGNYRSAISAFHLPTDGSSVGRHPRVSALMSGASNQRPPKPKYGFTWDVEVVLRFLKSWPPNEALTDKQLSLKMAMLLSLSAISRCSELHLLDLRLLSRYSSYFSFEIYGTMKHQKPNTKLKPIEFGVYSSDAMLCPVEVMKAYIARSEQWRGKRPGFSQLFLGMRNPHKPIDTTSISRWIKNLLELTGVDISVFQAHSVRGAASSRASMKGLTVKAVMDRGNWSMESTWQRFYHKEVLRPCHEFQNKVLQL